MQYRNDRYGNPISVLGYGCMRFTSTAGIIDLKKTEKEILAAIDQGVNYFDTAYLYPGSESALGTILEENNLRSKVNIATKLPHYMIKKEGDIERYFAEELKRLKTDHIDYYLMHMLTDCKTWERLSALGIQKWIADKKTSGQIRQIGFSYHGNSDMFCQLLDSYDWDFCQIQYNYLDENSQAGKTGLHYAAKKGIPVIIMEPLRGGKLVNGLPAKAVNLIKHHELHYSPAEWSFRWLWNQPEVTCVLSGMNSLEMVNENIKNANSAEVGSLRESDLAFIQKLIALINENTKVPCTGCRYCMPCPKGVDIPGTFSAYNHKYTDGRWSGQMEYMMCTILRKDPTSASNCIGCGKCELHCPQHISIRQQLQNAKRELEGPIYKVARKILPVFMKY